MPRKSKPRTKLKLDIKLIFDVPEDVLKVLRQMLGNALNERQIDEYDLPIHELFEDPSWEYVLKDNRECLVAESASVMRYDHDDGQYFLNIQTEKHNYNNEVERFVDWIDPYVDAFYGEYLGYKIRDGDDGKTPLFKERS